MQLTMRRYHHDDDYWKIRAFLREVFLANCRREITWQVARLDYWRWHVVHNCTAFPRIDDVLFIWETPTQQMAAVLNPEGPGEAFLQVHPAMRTNELENEMIGVAEEHLACSNTNGERKLCVWANQYDILRQEVLQQRGYTKAKWPEYQRQRLLIDSVPEVPVAAGYIVRSLGGLEELPVRSWASWRGFHPTASDADYEGWTWYLHIQQMPLYRRDLDIVAIAPGGEVASFCTIWYDDVTRTGYFEPVATVPEHQRLGLGKAVMSEAMRRLRQMGGTLATVGGYSQAANALYSSVVSPQYELSERWEKILGFSLGAEAL